MKNKLIFGQKLPNTHYHHRPGAYCVIFNDRNEIAILQVNQGYFLPGGGLHEHESYKDCLFREALEELGWEIEILAYLGNAGNYVYSPVRQRYYWIDGYFYLARKIRKICEPLEDDHDLIWSIPEESLPKLSANQAWAVKQAMKQRS